MEQTVEELKPSIELASIDTSTNVAVKRGNLSHSVANEKAGHEV